MTAVEFCGEKLELRPDGASEFAILEFAEAAEADAESAAGIGAQLRLIESGLAEKDASRFRSLARKHRVGVMDLVPLVQAVFEVKAEHPTGLPSDSSDGHEVTQLSSVSRPEPVDTDPFVGRPDMGLAVRRQMRAKAS